MIEFRDGFYADVRTEDRSRTVISYQAGILEEMKSQVERRAFLRVYDGKMWYYASVTDLNHLQKTLDGLYAAAAPNDQILDDPTVRRFERNRDTVLSFADCSVRDIPAKDKQALLLSYLPLLSEDKWHRTQILIQSAKVNGNRETGCKWVHNKTVATSAGCKRASRTEAAFYFAPKDAPSAIE